MNTTQSNDVAPGLALMAKVAQYAQSSRFAFQLQQQVVAHERALQVAARQAEDAARLLAAPSTDKLIGPLMDLAAAGTLRYGPTEWVPDAYQTLDHMGFVQCTHGPKDHRGLDSRTLELTAAGQDLVAKRKAVDCCPGLT